jgi:hypothetical protein
MKKKAGARLRNHNAEGSPDCDDFIPCVLEPQGDEKTFWGFFFLTSADIFKILLYSQSMLAFLGNFDMGDIDVDIWSFNCC